jgi:large subunit ribosomal protein L28
MASTCDICGKKPIFLKNLSHSHKRTSKRYNPNIQRIKAVVNKATKRINACTGCIKSGKVKKA